MRVLVTGGAGFLGSHLVERLVAEGHAVDAVDDLSSGSLANLADARVAGGELKFTHLDVTDAAFDELVALRRPEVVVHLAPLACGRVNATSAARSFAGTLGVLEAARAHGVAKVVVAVPAAALYGEVAARELPVKEGHVWQPVGVTGVVARAVVDALCVYRDQHQVEYTALALTHVYGPRQRADGGPIGAMVAARAARQAVVLHGDGRQTRDLLYVDDAVDALARAITKADGLVVNIGTGVQTSMRDAWALLTGPDGLPPRLEPLRSPGIGRFAVSPVRARIHLTWSPWTSLADGLASL